MEINKIVFRNLDLASKIRDVVISKLCVLLIHSVLSDTLVKCFLSCRFCALLRKCLEQSKRAGFITRVLRHHRSGNASTECKNKHRADRAALRTRDGVKCCVDDVVHHNFLVEVARSDAWTKLNAQVVLLLKIRPKRSPTLRIPPTLRRNHPAIFTCRV